jgi:Icc protein
VLIAQITDMHIRRKGDLLHHMIHTGRELRRCVAAINALPVPPAFVVATGDLVDRGKRKEYRRLHKILAGLSVPCFLVAGNHDDREGLRETFPEHHYLPRAGPLSYVVETRPVRLVALDTVRPGRAHGELDAGRLAWLDARLREAPATPTLIAMHHPPFATGAGPLDDVHVLLPVRGLARPGHELAHTRSHRRAPADNRRGLFFSSLSPRTRRRTR